MDGQKLKNDQHQHESGSGQKAFAPVMMILEQLAHRKRSLSAGVDHHNTIASVEIKQECSVDSGTETELPEPAITTTGDTVSVLGILQQLELLTKRHPPRVAVRAKGRIFFIEIAGIIAVHAEGNYVSLKHRSSPYLLREPLSSIAVKLKPYGFIQIRRSVLVNISVVDEIQPLPSGEYRLRVKDGNEYVVTRTYKENLKRLAHLWLGSDGPGSHLRTEQT